MILLDMRTIVFSNVVTDIVCILVILLLWHQSRKRFAGTIVAHHGRSGKEHLNLLVSSCLRQMLDPSGRTQAQGPSSLMSKALRAPGMRRGQGLRILLRVVTHGRKRR